MVGILGLCSCFRIDIQRVARGSETNVLAQQQTYQSMPLDSIDICVAGIGGKNGLRVGRNKTKASTCVYKHLRRGVIPAGTSEHQRRPHRDHGLTQDPCGYQVTRLPLPLPYFSIYNKPLAIDIWWGAGVTDVTRIEGVRPVRPRTRREDAPKRGRMGVWTQDKVVRIGAPCSIRGAAGTTCHPSPDGPFVFELSA